MKLYKCQYSAAYLKNDLEEIGLQVQGSKLSFISREPNHILKSYLKMLCIEKNTSLGSLLKFVGDAGEFNGALGSWHPLISSLEVRSE